MSSYTVISAKYHHFLDEYDRGYYIHFHQKSTREGLAEKMPTITSAGIFTLF
jgi:hypothetical protein